MPAPSSAPDERARALLPKAHAHELVAALARGEVSASALCEAAIARIEALDGALNAVVVRDFERARRAAHDADRALRAGERRPLLGLPMTVKEAFDVEGLPTTWGDPAARSHRAHEDAVCVARLKQAGAVILGKTNVSVGLMDWQSVNPVYGRTSHPHDPTRTPGGSSGGSAAAVAAGLSPLELGSDIGGSIRVPASFCGIYGHKPSYGLLPARGHAPAQHDGVSTELAVVGPFARCAEDLRLALSVLAGPDLEEAVGYRLALPPARVDKLEQARLLILRAHPSASTDAAIVAALERLAERLGRRGARIADASPLLPDLAAAHRLYLKLLRAITTRGQPPSDRLPSVHAWFDLLDERARVRRKWRALFEQFDGVIAPAFGSAAFAHVDEPDWSLRTLQIDGRATAYGAQLAWPGVATLPGLPATAVPVGTTAQGLPIGVQVIGPYLEDLTTIGLAEQIGGLTD